MFQCKFCKVTVAPHTPQQKVVIETKQVTYPARPKAHRYAKRLAPDKKRQFCCDKEGKWISCHCCDHGGVGVEIVREAILCAPCAERFRQQAEILPQKILYSQQAA